MGVRVIWGGLLSLLLTVGAAVAAEPGPDVRQRHEARASEGDVGVATTIEVEARPGRPASLRQDVRVQGLPEAPQAPAGPAALDPPGLPLGERVPTLPNLVPLPPYDIFVGPAEQPQGPVWSNLQTLGAGEPAARTALRFTTTIQNRARHSFELVGTPWTPDPGHPDLTTTHAYQCVRFGGPYWMGAQRACLDYQPVGTLTWHAQHRHFHVNGFGRYELRRDRGGRPDMTPAGVVGRSAKVGWCVSDMFNWREDAGPEPVNEATDEVADPAQRAWYQECTSPLLYTGSSWRQGISPGWADTYPARYSGQEIPLQGVADGDYWIVTTINPKDNDSGLRIAESTWADNTSASKVRLHSGGTKATLLAPMPTKPYADWYENPDDQPGQ
jgi:hypothetical protein